MKEYIGIKYIKAEPMWISEAMDLGIVKDDRNKDVDKANIEGYKVVYPQPNGTEYISWSPKDVFESAYKELDVMKEGK